MSDSSVGIYGARTNRLPNGGFAVDTRYWGTVNCTIEQDDTHVMFGVASLKVTITSVSSTPYIRTSRALPAPEAGAWAYGAWLHGPAAKNANLYLYETGGSQSAAICGPGSQTTTLGAGWTEAHCVATVAQADRDDLECRISFGGSQIGDVYWVAGVRACPDVWVPPYIASNEVEPIYVPASNIGGNGDFETNASGWAGSAWTITRDNAHAYSGSWALKLVAVNTGNINVLTTNFVTGAPLPQVLYAVVAWCWAEGNVVGKNWQLSMQGVGGPHGTVSIGGTASSTRRLRPGWNYQIAYGTPVWDDHNELRLLVYLHGAEVGDAIWLDAVQCGTDYVPPAPTTVSRTAGRIQVASTGLSPVEGFVAMRVDPDWGGWGNAMHRRPTPPLTLWEWVGDEDNSLRLWWDGGYLTMERRNPDGADIARSPWVPQRGVDALLVGSWDGDGTYASAEGRPLIGPVETFVADDFERADGALGVTPIGGVAWQSLGGIAYGINSGRLAPNAGSGNGNAYPILRLAETPYRWGGTVSYTGTSTLNTTMAIQADDLNTQVHMLHERTRWAHQSETDNSGLGTKHGHSYAVAIPADGTPVSQCVAVDGDTIVVEEFDGTAWAMRDPDAPERVGPQLLYEFARNGDEVSRWDSIWVQRRGIWTPGGGHIPVIPAETIDLGSSAGADHHFAGRIHWYAAGRGTLDNATIAALAPLDDTPRRALMQRLMPTIRHLWPAKVVT